MLGVIDLAGIVAEGRHVSVGEVEVVGQFGMLGGNGGDALHGRNNALLLTILAHLEILFLHVAVLGLQHEAGNLEVAETSLFYL